MEESMKTKGIISSLLITSALILSFGTALASQDIISTKVKESPAIDGVFNDKVWEGIKSYKVKDVRTEADVTIKSVYTDDMIYFLLSYPDATEDRLHKPWVWDKEMESYILGPQREDTFTIKWNMMDHKVDLSSFSDDDYTADIWYWKANRTDPSGYADDKYDIISAVPQNKSQEVVSRTGKKRYLLRMSDEGNPSYQNIILTGYKSDMIDQFLHLKPSGSMADILAKGTWKEGVWTVEFGRKLDTGHSDDILLNPRSGKKYLFGISIPGLYGEPIDKKAAHWYGQGRISEPLFLIFK